MIRSITSALRDWVRAVYEVDEANGETVEVALDADGDAHIQIVRRPNAYGARVTLEGRIEGLTR